MMSRYWLRWFLVIFHSPSTPATSSLNVSNPVNHFFLSLIRHFFLVISSFFSGSSCVDSSKSRENRKTERFVNTLFRLLSLQYLHFRSSSRSKIVYRENKKRGFSRDYTVYQIELLVTLSWASSSWFCHDQFSLETFFLNLSFSTLIYVDNFYHNHNHGKVDFLFVEGSVKFVLHR